MTTAELLRRPVVERGVQTFAAIFGAATLPECSPLVVVTYKAEG